MAVRYECDICGRIINRALVVECTDKGLRPMNPEATERYELCEGCFDMIHRYLNPHENIGLERAF